jgi:hypothetical protein
LNSISGISAADTGILTYKTIQTLLHNNDTVTIIATDVAGNKTEQLIAVSVKAVDLSSPSIIISINTWKVGAKLLII